MTQGARWLVLTKEGRRVLLACYGILALTSVVTYWIVRGPGYALGQAAILGFAPLWARYCLRRPWPDDATAP
jgi:hypothetical protein